MGITPPTSFLRNPFCSGSPSDFEGDVDLKEYECVEVKHHKDVGRTIEDYQRDGWSLHTYQTSGMGAGPMSYVVNHYLLFERGS